MTPAAQTANVAIACHALAALIADGHQIIVTHGNGPQIGLLALQGSVGAKGAAQPLDVLGAETDGMIGYLIEQALAGLLSASAEVVTLLTRIRVDAADPAFIHPSKPIGPFYDEAAARSLAADRGWQVARDGPRWRRVVASPEPLEILEIRAIKRLVDAGVVVICAGGGGIPVTATANGGTAGVEAVIDKDSASCLLAQDIHADRLLLLTDVDAVYVDFGLPTARAIRSAGSDSLAGIHFASGSMGPKIDAAAHFVRSSHGGTGGRQAAIGRLADAVAILRGEAGTCIQAGRGAVTIRDSAA
jgi:carbamate kinase